MNDFKYIFTHAIKEVYWNELIKWILKGTDYKHWKKISNRTSSGEYTQSKKKIFLLLLSYWKDLTIVISQGIAENWFLALVNTLKDDQSKLKTHSI